MDASQILQRLNPISQSDIMMTIYGIMLYAVFILAILFLARQKTPNQFITFIMVAVMLFALIDKIGVGYATNNLFPARGCEAFPLLFMRVAMFVLPLIAVGVSQWPKSRPLGLMCGGVGFLYFWLRGITDMQLLVGGAMLSC